MTSDTDAFYALCIIPSTFSNLLSPSSRLQNEIHFNTAADVPTSGMQTPQNQPVRPQLTNPTLPGSSFWHNHHQSFFSLALYTADSVLCPVSTQTGARISSGGIISNRFICSQKITYSTKMAPMPTWKSVAHTAVDPVGKPLKTAHETDQREKMSPLQVSGSKGYEDETTFRFQSFTN